MSLNIITRVRDKDETMKNWYSELKKLNGQKCYTLTQDRPATMYIDDNGVTIVYPSGNSLLLPRSMITEAVHRLQSNGSLTLQEVHEEITHRNGPQSDRLMAVLRTLPGVTFSAVPRVLYLN